MLIFGMIFSCGIRDPYLYRMTTWLLQFSFQFGLITNASDDVLGKQQGCKGRAFLSLYGMQVTPTAVEYPRRGYGLVPLDILEGDTV